jgi:hypothetical protein
MHEQALKSFGLVDENGKPTWFSDGKPDALKMFSITGEHMQGMSPEDRTKYGRAAFGTQGSGAVAVLSDPQVQEQIRNLDKLRSSPEFLESYRNFSSNYQAGSTMQDARTAIAQFNVTMGELARVTLPSINVALGGFKSVLEGIRNLLPGGNGQGAAVVGGHAILGAGAGALTGAAIGAFGGPVGAVGGAVIGGTLGVAEAYLKNQSLANAAEMKKQTLENAERLERQMQNRVREFGLGNKFGGKEPNAPVPPIHLNLNIDGRALAAAVSEQQNSQSQYTTDTPASNGTSLYGP